MSEPKTPRGPTGGPDVDRALAATRKANAVALFEVRLQLATAAWAALLAPDSPLKPHDRARVREARRAFMEATTRHSESPAV